MFHVKHSRRRILQFIPSPIQQEFALDDIQMQKLEIWIEQLLLWQQKINLISPASIHDIWSRHVADSLQLLSYLPKNMTGDYLDIGSGAGFPGLALSLIWQNTCHLVDADQKKSLFLKEVVRLWDEVGRIQIHNKRIDQLENIGNVGVISARALASLNELLHMVYPLIHKDTILLFPKGKSWSEEKCKEGREKKLV